MEVDDLGNVYVTGDSWGPNYEDVVTFKYNTEGELQWDIWYDNYAVIFGVDFPQALDVDESGNVLITGLSVIQATGSDILTIKYSPTVSISLSYIGNTQIPNQGGELTYNCNLVNNSEEMTTIDLWSDLVFPADSILSPAYLVENISIEAGGFIEDEYRIEIPESYPTGDYIHNIYAGSYSDGIWHQQQIYLSKLPPSLALYASIDDNNVNLSWQGVPYALSYRLYRSLVPYFDYTTLIPIAVTNDTSFVDEGIINQGSYFYIVTYDF